MIRIMRWLSIVGFTLAAVFFWQRGDWEIVLTSIIIPVLAGLVPLLFQKDTMDEKKHDSRLKSILKGKDFKKRYFTPQLKRLPVPLYPLSLQEEFAGV